MDGDGNLDVVSVNGSGEVSILLGDRTGAFELDSAFFTGVQPSMVGAIADLNGDGIPTC